MFPCLGIREEALVRDINNEMLESPILTNLT